MAGSFVFAGDTRVGALQPMNGGGFYRILVQGGGLCGGYQFVGDDAAFADFSGVIGLLALISLPETFRNQSIES